MAIKYERQLTQEEEDILKHNLVDIKDWVDKAILGKINNTLSRAYQEYKVLLAKENAQNLPLNDRDAFNAYKRRPDYRNRQQRDSNER